MYFLPFSSDDYLSLVLTNHIIMSKAINLFLEGFVLFFCANDLDYILWECFPRVIQLTAIFYVSFSAQWFLVQTLH